MEPGLVSSTKILFKGDNYTNHAYEAGVLVNPFTEDRRVSCFRKPVVCMACGGFLNLHCRLTPQTGEWVCNLCTAVNATLYPPNSPGYDDEECYRQYPELQSRHIDYIEDVYPTSGVSSEEWSSQPTAPFVHVLAIDDTLCNNAIELKVFLHRIFSSVTSCQRIAIICYGKCLSLLRLCGGLSQSVAVDVLPGHGDATKTIDHFISQGVYLTSATVALQEVGRIAKTLFLLSNEGNGNAGKRQGDRKSGPEPVASVESIVATACALGNVSWNPGVRLLIVTGRSIPHLKSNLNFSTYAHGGLADGTREARNISAYALLGRQALFPPRSWTCEGGGGCWIDVVRVGCRSIRTDTLEALCSSSGGMVFRSFTLADSHMLESVSASIQLGGHCFPRGGTIGTLEIRTSRGLQVSHVVGSVLSAEDCNSIPGVRLDLATVDIRHLHPDSVSQAQPNELVGIPGKFFDDTVYVNKKSYKRLYDYAKQHVLVCGLTRLDPNCSVSIQCVPTAEAVSLDRVSLQCVVRYSTCPRYDDVSVALPNPKDARRFQEIVRVMNVELICSDDKELFLQSLDVELWTLLMARSIVADFHLDQIDYESKRAAQFRAGMEKDADSETSTPRQEGIMTIERLVKDILNEWCPSSPSGEMDAVSADATERAVRSLFHLWQGPLLDGPSMHPQDSFLLRSYFLSGPAKHALRLMRPELEIFFQPSKSHCHLRMSNNPNKATDNTAGSVSLRPSLPPPGASVSSPGLAPSSGQSLSSETVGYSTLKNPQPDTLWLVPGTIIIIDVGYNILIWGGKNLFKEIMRYDPDDEIPEKLFDKEYSKSLEDARNFCLQRAMPRRPVAEVTVIESGSSAERMVFSTLSPSHMDRLEVIDATAPHLASSPWSAFREKMLERCPFTDQQTLSMFIMRISSSHGEVWCRFGSFLRTITDRMASGVDAVPQMERGSMLEPTIDILDAL